MAPLALGTDGGGSIRIPASFCGIVGVKPSFGRVPQWPRSPFASLSHLGPMAWTVADAALLLDAIAGPDILDPSSRFLPDMNEGVRGIADLRGVRVALSLDLGYVNVEEEVACAVRSAAGVLEELGAEVTEADPPFDDPVQTFDALWSVGVAKAVQTFPADVVASMDPGLLALAEAGAGVSGVDYRGLLDRQSALAQEVHAFLSLVDLLVTPTLPIVAFDVGMDVPERVAEPELDDLDAIHLPAQSVGDPAVSVPCGFTSTGLPIGFQLVGGQYTQFRPRGCSGVPGGLPSR